MDNGPQAQSRSARRAPGTGVGVGANAWHGKCQNPNWNMGVVGVPCFSKPTCPESGFDAAQGNVACQKPRHGGNSNEERCLNRKENQPPFDYLERSGLYVKVYNRRRRPRNHRQTPCTRRYANHGQREKEKKRNQI